MSYRFLMALTGLIIVVGSGSMWLYYNILLKKKLLQNLLSLPKGRRFFWYRLRKSGFEVISQNLFKKYSLCVGGVVKSYSLKADFLVKRKGKRYIGLYAGELEEKEFLMLFFSYSRVFHTHGVIFYNDILRKFILWEV